MLCRSGDDLVLLLQRVLCLSVDVSKDYNVVEKIVNQVINVDLIVIVLS